MCFFGLTEGTCALLVKNLSYLTCFLDLFKQKVSILPVVVVTDLSVPVLLCLVGHICFCKNV